MIKGGFIMDLQKAITIFKKEKPKYHVQAYAPCSDGIILVAESMPGIIECNYYKVKENGTIMPVHPMKMGVPMKKFKSI